VNPKLRNEEHSDVAARPDLMHGLMLSVVAFMAKTGMSPGSIQGVFERCVTKPRSAKGNGKASSAPSVAYGCDTIAGAVLRAWHKVPLYLDSKARPLRLRLGGVEPNLTSLILSQDDRANSSDVIRSMLNAGLLRKSGRGLFSPARDAATLESLDPLAVDHIAKTIMRLVETATRNVAKSRDKLQLIERYAHVPNLTRSQAKAFALFSRQQGQACLDTIEDWLETRQTNQSKSPRKASRGVNAGVHIFAYLGEPAPKRMGVLAGAQRRRATSAPEARA
jgi:hypothetical protein